MENWLPFAYSRNPVEFLDRDTAGIDPRWFVDKGLRTLRAFVRKLRAHPRVTAAEINVKERRFTDVVGHCRHFQVDVSIGFDDHPMFRVRGSGHAPDRAQARAAAVGEVLERLALQRIPGQRSSDGSLIRPAVGEWSSNGACFHSLPSRAVCGGICELLERDALLCNWYSDARLPVTRIEPGHPLYRPKAALAEIGWELQEHAWRHDKVAASCVMVSLSRIEPAEDEWNFFIGGSARPSYRRASASALIESLFMARTWQRAFDAVDTTSEAPPALYSKPEYRLFLCQRPAYVAAFRTRLQAPAPPARPARAMREDRFIRSALTALPSLQIIPLPLPAPFADKMFCIKAECPELQGIDWNFPPNYNFRRIRARYATPRNKLSKLLHPFC